MRRGLRWLLSKLALSKLHGVSRKARMLESQFKIFDAQNTPGYAPRHRLPLLREKSAPQAALHEFWSLRMNCMDG
jgi:hypothetical protein